MSIDMYLPAFPALQATFATDAAAVQRTLSVFFIGLALGQLFYGPLSDRYGRRLPLLVGLALYTRGLGRLRAGGLDCPADVLARAAGARRVRRRGDGAGGRPRRVRAARGGARLVVADARHGRGAHPGADGRRVGAGARRVAGAVRHPGRVRGGDVGRRGARPARHGARGTGDDAHGGQRGGGLRAGGEARQVPPLRVAPGRSPSACCLPTSPARRSSTCRCSGCRRRDSRRCSASIRSG